MTDLSDHHALVTGGGSGIGAAIARALAGAGARVTITGRRAGALDEVADTHPTLFAQVMDVTSEDSVTTGIAAAVAARGPISICVANAGIAEGRSLARTDMDLWRRIMATNLDGAFLTIRESLRSMTDLPMGRVIAVSSIAGVRGLKGAAAYTASKHGLVGLVRALSEDYVGRPITFNALCPGYVDTDIVARNREQIAARTGLDADAALAAMVDANRHRRLLTADEVAAAALWLCDPASASVNGQTIEIAGGQV